MDTDLYQEMVKPYALDDRFGELMDESVGAPLPQTKLGQPEVGASPKRWQQRRRSSVDLGGNVSRLLMHYLGQLCMVDLYGGRSIKRCALHHHHHHHHHQRSPPAANNDKNRNLESNPESDEPKLPWWPRAIRYVYCYCILKLLATLYYQYRYDFNLTRHERLRSYLAGMGDLRPPKFFYQASRATLGDWPALVEQGQATLGEFEQNIAHARWALKLLGAPYMQLRFSVECTYIFFLLVSLGLYAQTQVFFTYVHPFDFALVRSVMDFRRELRLCNRLIRFELNKFIESSRVFTAIVVAEQPRECCRPTRATSGCCTKSRVSHHLWRLDDAEIRRVLGNHASTIERVREMALSGKLVPANKWREWVRHVAHANCFYTITYLTYCLVVGIILAVVLPMQLEVSVETEPMDLVTTLELLFLVIVLNLSSTFWGSIVLATSLDQVHLVRELKLKFDRLLEVNKALVRSSLEFGTSASFAREEDDRQMALAAANLTLGNDTASRRPWTAAPSVASPREQVAKADAEIRKGDAIDEQPTKLDGGPIQAQLDGDLLELLLSYKIFVAQLEPLKRSYGFVTLTTYTLMILMPVIGRLHVPYVDGRIKLYVGALSLLCTLVCDLLILIPVSYLYTRCIALHTSLSSVLAHTIEVSQVTEATTATATNTTRPTRRGGRRLARRRPFSLYGYNEHTVFALRKELRHPERLVDQFATTVLGIRLTYSNLLKIHFWIGFITQSFMFESSAGASRGEVPQDMFGSIFADPLGLR